MLGSLWKRASMGAIVEDSGSSVHGWVAPSPCAAHGWSSRAWAWLYISMMLAGPFRIGLQAEQGPQPDRKSTRLNSSHSQISYAVFCLKKKKKQKRIRNQSL